MSLLKSILKRVDNIDVDVLQSEHEETLTALSKLQREHEDLIVNLTSIKDENTKLKEETEKWGTYKSNYELKAAALQNNLNRVGTLSAEQAQRIKDLEHTVEKANAALDLLKKNNRILQVNCDTAVKTIEQKENVIKELEVKLHTHEEEQKQELELISSEREDAESQLTEALAKIENLSLALEDAEQKAKVAEEQWHQVNEENQKLRAEKQSYLENLKTLDDQVVDLQEKHQLQQQQLEKAENQISKYQDDYELLLHQMSALQEEVERLHATGEGESIAEYREKKEEETETVALDEDVIRRGPDEEAAVVKIPAEAVCPVAGEQEKGDSEPADFPKDSLAADTVSAEKTALVEEVVPEDVPTEAVVSAADDASAEAVAPAAASIPVETPVSEDVPTEAVVSAADDASAETVAPAAASIPVETPVSEDVPTESVVSVADVASAETVASAAASIPVATPVSEEEGVSVGEVASAEDVALAEDPVAAGVEAEKPIAAETDGQTEEKEVKSTYRLPELLDHKEETLEETVAITIWKMEECGESVTPFPKGKKWGFVYGDVVLAPPVYTDYEAYGEHGDILVKGNRCVGLLNKYGQVLIPCKYLEFKELENGMVLGADAKHHFVLGTDVPLCQRKPNDDFTFVHETENIVKVHVSNEKYSNQFDFYIFDNECFFFKLPDGNYQLITWVGKSLGIFSDYRFTQNRENLWVQEAEHNHWGLIDLNGVLLSDVFYDSLELHQYGGGDCYVGLSNGHSAIYDLNGLPLCKTEYDSLKIMEVQDLICCLATKGEKKGVVTLTGEVLVPIAYDDVSCSLTSSFFVATQNGESYFYTLQGQQVTLPEEGMVGKGAHHYLEISKDNLWGMMDANSNIVLEVKYESITYLAKFGAFVLKKGEVTSLFLPEQQLLKKLPSGEVRDLNERFLIVYDGEQCGLIDHSCRLILPIAYQSIFSFSDTSDYLGLRKDDSKYGIADADGKICVDPQFKNVYYMTGDVFRLEVEDGWFLYKISRGIISTKYTYIYPYEGGDTIKVTKMIHDLSVVGNVDLNGHEIVTSEIPLENDCKIVEIFGKWGVVNAEGTYIVPLLEGRKLEKLSQDFLKCTEHRKCGVMDVNNRLIVDFSYTDVIFEEGSRYFILKQSEENTYSWLRSEGNTYYLLMGIDGTQNEIPASYRGTYSSMNFVTPNLVQLPEGLLSLSDFTFAEGKFQKIVSDDGLLYVENLYAKKGVLSTALQWLVPCLYDKIEKLGEHLLKCQTMRNSLYSSSQKNKEYDIYTFEGGKINRIPLDSVGPVKKEVIEVKFRGKGGLLSSQGEILPTATLTLKEDLTAECKLGFWEIRNKGEVVLSLENQIDKVEYLDDNVICIKKNYLYGVIREDGSEVFPCQYESIEKWKEGILKVGLQGYELFTYDGVRCTEYRYSKIGVFHGEKVAAVRNDDSVKGWLDAQGKETFIEDIPINDYLHKHEIFGKWELVDQKGNVLSANLYDEIRQIDEGRVEVRDGERLGVYAASGELYVPVGYTALEYPSKDDVICEEQGRYCLYNKNIRVIADCVSIHLWHEHIFLCKKEDAASSGYALIDGEGTVLTQHLYDEIRPLGKDGRAEAIYHGRWGWINRNGKEISDHPEYLSEKYLKRQSLGCYEVVDRQGNIVLPAQYTEVQVYQEDIFLVYLDRLKGLVSCHGEVLIPVKYDSIQVFDGEGYLVKAQDRYGVFNASFQLVVPVEYKSIALLDKGKYVAESQEGFVLYDQEGHRLTDAVYDTLEKLKDSYAAGEHLVQEGVVADTGVSDGASEEVSDGASDGVETDFSSVAEGTILEGEVLQIDEKGVALRLFNGDAVLLHESAFEAIGFQKSEIESGWLLTIKKIGFDESQGFEQWEILDINIPQ